MLQTIAIPSFSFEFACRRISRSGISRALGSSRCDAHAPISRLRRGQSSANLTAVPIEIPQTSFLHVRYRNRRQLAACSVSARRTGDWKQGNSAPFARQPPAAESRPCFGLEVRVGSFSGRPARPAGIATIADSAALDRIGRQQRLPRLVEDQASARDARPRDGLRRGRVFGGCGGRRPDRGRRARLPGRGRGPSRGRFRLQSYAQGIFRRARQHKLPLSPTNTTAT